MINVSPANIPNAGREIALEIKLQKLTNLEIEPTNRLMNAGIYSKNDKIGYKTRGKTSFNTFLFLRFSLVINGADSLMRDSLLSL